MLKIDKEFNFLIIEDIKNRIIKIKNLENLNNLEEFFLNYYDEFLILQRLNKTLIELKLLNIYLFKYKIEKLEIKIKEIENEILNKVLKSFNLFYII
jgi:hypothetical protein